jgi:hypothetical protein
MFSLQYFVHWNKLTKLSVSILGKGTSAYNSQKNVQSPKITNNVERESKKDEGKRDENMFGAE